MGIHRIPGGAGVLGGDAARLRPLLQKAGLVDDQHTAYLVPQVLDDVVTQVVTHPVGVPSGGIEQALRALWARFADRFGELPAILPFHPVEQTNEVPSGPFTHFHPPEPMGDASHQVVQGL